MGRKRNVSIPKGKKNQEVVEEKQRGNDKMTIIISIISISVSVGALVLGIYSYVLAQNEYKYKLDPVVDVLTTIRLKRYESENGIEDDVILNKAKLQILNPNNLESIYLINSQKEVERIEVEDFEEDIKFYLSDTKSDPDLWFKDHTKIRYKYVLLKSLDDTYSLYLIYSETKGNYVTFNGVSGIEVYGLEQNKSEGIQMMIQGYKEILKALEEYGG